MPAETLSGLADRILQHARRHRLASVNLVLHGGEPLLAGHARLAEYAATLRSKLAEIPAVDLRIHTNGVQLDEDFCAIFNRYEIKVGVSVDGHRAANDLHRRFANGRSSYPFVERALQLLRKDENKHIYAGLLCTVDTANDPIAVYDALRAFEPPRIDFLLPHATWDEPPVRPATGLLPGAGPETAYADWLIAVFERWNADGRPMPVRFFDSIESLARGGPSQTESLGPGPADLVVVETDGSFEQVDSLKVVGDGAAATGLDVFRHSLDEVAAHPGIAARRQGLAGLCATCLACPIVDICGGGLYTHRFKTESGFDNPSAYCADLKKLIAHVTAGMPGQVRRSVRQDREVVASGPLSEAVIDELAAGVGGAATVAGLAGAQRDLLRVLLSTLAENVDDLPGWDLLTRLDEEHPQALDSVLAHPFVRAWAQETFTALRAVPAQRKAPPALGHLAGIAAAAAIRAGVEAQVEVPVIEGALHLPTLGRLLLDGDSPARTVISRADGFAVAGDGASYAVRLNSAQWPDALDSMERWQPVRHLYAPNDPAVHASDRFVCAIEDGDPFRDCFAWPAARRLSAGEAGTWQARFSLGWALILRHYPSYAPGLRAGLSTLTPLSASGESGVGASSTRAFGAIGVGLPDDGAGMALLLMREWQRVRLAAVADFYDLVDPQQGRLYHVPWHREPRGASQFLLDTYAQLATTDFWRVRRTTAESAQDRERAAGEFDRSLRMTAEAVEVLAGSGAMTALGRRFADGLRAAIEPWFTG